jgi:hypothetical protein
MAGVQHWLVVDFQLDVVFAYAGSLLLRLPRDLVLPNSLRHLARVVEQQGAGCGEAQQWKHYKHMATAQGAGEQRTIWGRKWRSVRRDDACA